MVQFFINRAGRNLPARRRREVEIAKRLLQAQARVERRPRAEAAGRGSRVIGAARV
jgi:hypothetical protein